MLVLNISVAACAAPCVSRVVRAFLRVYVAVCPFAFPRNPLCLHGIKSLLKNFDLRQLCCIFAP